jgi:serine/threonine protein kinase
MLTGRTTFEGETVTEVIASVLKQEADLSRIPPNVHLRVVELIRRCLAKDPKKRWHAAADVRMLECLDGNWRQSSRSQLSSLQRLQQESCGE